MKILLAEDDPNISLIAKMALEQLGGHQVTVAEDGEAALQLALTEKFDVILLDEMMPKMNGLTVCREYNLNSMVRKPIIFLSAKSQEVDVKEFLDCSVGHIPKPFEPTTLCQSIEDLLKNYGIRAAA